MGMELSSTKKGKQFRANVWSWRPIWNLVRIEADLTDEEYESGSMNDGYEISEERALEIHNKLKKLNLKAIIKEYHHYLDTLPLEDCEICKGTGKRNDEHVKGKCNSCNTKYSKEEGIPVGKQKNWQTNYRMYQEHIEEFIEYCKESRGFQIW